MPERVILCGKCHIPANITVANFEGALLNAVCPRCGREDKGGAVEDALSKYLVYELDWKVANSGHIGPTIGIDQKLNDGFRWIINQT